MLSLHDNPADRGQPGGANNGPIRRIARSKNGCVTCRRRKVRCDEQRPRCSHCERLNLHCQWRPLIHTTSAPGTSRRASSTPNGSARLAHAELPAGRRSDIQSPDNLGSVASPASSQLLHIQNGQPGAGVDQFFDYASFMWSDAAGLWGQFGMPAGDESMDASLRLGTPTTASVSTDTGRRLDLALRDAAAQERQMASPQSSQQNNALAAPASVGLSVFRGEDSDLLTYFVHTVVPPILAEVETQKKWASMRLVLISMAAASTMVRCAILAFSNLLRCRRETPWSQVNQHYYENAAKELDAAGELPSPERHSSRRQSLLATLFFLCYIDILEERNETTHANLKRAYTIFRQGDRKGFHPVEMHLLSWIRLLDARAVSAGGEGLFLTDQDETLLVQPSPGSLHDSANDAVEGAADRAMDSASSLLHAGAGPDRDIEDVLFELLYQPGIVFYQKVQSFMGRISKIDPWHRSRGTVEDETEVMNIAAGILRDLRALLADGCPALMPHAVAGKLKAPYVSRYLAFTITRAFRTYLSNYYASKLHLHRVAYRHLPLSSESKDALAQIRHLARLMVDDAGPVPDEQHEQQQHTDMTPPMAAGEPEGAIISDTRFASVAAEDASTSSRGQPQHDEQGQQHSQQPQLSAQTTLPVNMLWPLLMWGTEEKDLAERDWIRDQILRMEKVASNARATAQVLEEVQRRQDATNTRQDVRAVMHTVFDSCWAIV